MSDWDMSDWSDFLSILSGVVSLLCVLASVIRWLQATPSSEFHTSADLERPHPTTSLGQSVLQFYFDPVGKYLVPVTVASVLFFIVIMLVFRRDESQRAFDELKQASAFAGAQVKNAGGESNIFIHYETWNIEFGDNGLERIEKGFSDACEKEYRDWFELPESARLASVSFEVKVTWWNAKLVGIHPTFVGANGQHTGYDRRVFFTVNETVAWARRLENGLNQNGFRSYPLSKN